MLSAGILAFLQPCTVPILQRENAAQIRSLSFSVHVTPKSVLGEGEAPEKPSLSHPDNVAADGEVGSDVSLVRSSSQLVPTSVSIESKKKKKKGFQTFFIRVPFAALQWCF